MNKIIYTTILISLAILTNAQVSIGGKKSVEGTSTILDFNSPLSANTTSTTNDNTNGIILPAVNNTSKVLPINDLFHNNGTFLFDKSDNKVKMYQNNEWVTMSKSGNSSKIIDNTSIDSDKSIGVIMGSSTSNAKGILILESSDKALILPRIANPDQNVKSPYVGMICYDTVDKSLAVFDGINWNYWK